MAKNITLAVDEAVLERVRIVAAERRTSVSGLVRDYLQSVAAAEDRTDRARQRLLELARTSTAEAGPQIWTRDELYDR